MDSQPALRYVTASLQLDFLKPTPIGEVLELRAKIVEVTERKVRMELWLSAGSMVTVRANMLSVLLTVS